MARRLVLLLVALALWAGGGAVAGASNLSIDGRTATDGTRALTVSQVSDLMDGQALRVTGTGFDTFKGIYVAYCVVPAPGQAPSPCGGGADLSGAAGSSHWISSNPPPYGVGLAVPYGPGGSFDVTVHVSPLLDTTTDCRIVRSAVVTRNDHTRSADRSQDLVVPVSFAAPAAPPPTTGASAADPGASQMAAGPSTADPAAAQEAIVGSETTEGSVESTTTAPPTETTLDGEATGVDGEQLAAARAEGGPGSDTAAAGIVALAAIGALAALGAGGVVVLRRRRA